VASEQSIINQALAALGQEATETLNLQDAKTPTRRLLVFADQALDEVLTFYPWVETQRHPVLTQVAPIEGDEDWRYPHVFKLAPSILRVIDAAGCGAWQVSTRKDAGSEERVIRAAGAGPLKLTCIQRIDWQALPTHLVTPAALKLAALAAFAVTGDANLADRLETRAKAALIEATRKDGTQEGGQDPPVGDRMHSLRQSAV
jgi:hypothetical protein